MNKEDFEKVLERVKNGENTSGFNPIEFKVVLLNDFVESTTGGGIIEKPESQIEKEQRAQTKGYVVAVSEMAFTDGEGNRWRCNCPKQGDKVLFSKYAGQLYEEDGVTYRVVNDKDIVAIIN